MQWYTLVLAFVLLTSCGQKPGNSDKETESQDEETIEALKLPGLAPVDIYLNMEKQGFTTEKSLGGEYGNTWTCKSSSGGVDYDVSVFSTSSMDVETVSATAMNSDGNYRATIPFLKYVASAPIDGVDRDAVHAWIDANIEKDKVKFESGDVRFELYAPTKFVRMISIMHKGRRE
jgi:hypothetical protein